MGEIFIIFSIFSDICYFPKYMENKIGIFESHIFSIFAHFPLRLFKKKKTNHRRRYCRHKTLNKTQQSVMSRVCV